MTTAQERKSQIRRAIDRLHAEPPPEGSRDWAEQQWDDGSALAWCAPEIADAIAVRRAAARALPYFKAQVAERNRQATLDSAAQMAALRAGGAYMPAAPASNPVVHRALTGTNLRQVASVLVNNGVRESECGALIRTLQSTSGWVPITPNREAHLSPAGTIAVRTATTRTADYDRVLRRLGLNADSRAKISRSLATAKVGDGVRLEDGSTITRLADGGISVHRGKNAVSRASTRVVDATWTRR